MPLLQQESLNMMIVITVMNNVRDYNVDRDILREVQHACTPFLKFQGVQKHPWKYSTGRGKITSHLSIKQKQK